MSYVKYLRNQRTYAFIGNFHLVLYEGSNKEGTDVDVGTQQSTAYCLKFPHRPPIVLNSSSMRSNSTSDQGEREDSLITTYTLSQEE